MSESLAAEIRHWLGRVLTGEITLREFQEWFVPATWDIHLVGTAGDQELAYEVELALAEYSSSHRTEAELRDLLSQAASDRLTSGSRSA